MHDYIIGRPYLSSNHPSTYVILTTAQKAQSCRRRGDVAPQLGQLLARAALMLAVALLLTGCGEEVKPTVSPQNAALNFFHFLSEGASDNAATYWLPNQLTEADRSQITAAAASLTSLKLRNPKAEVSPTPLALTPSPDSDIGATVLVTVTAEVQAADDSWLPNQTMLTAEMSSTSIGWRVRDFNLLIEVIKEGDY